MLYALLITAEERKMSTLLKYLHRPLYMHAFFLAAFKAIATARIFILIHRWDASRAFRIYFINLCLNFVVYIKMLACEKKIVKTNKSE